MKNRKEPQLTLGRDYTPAECVKLTIVGAVLVGLLYALMVLIGKGVL